MNRQQYLQQLLKVLPEDRTTTPGDQLPGTPPPHISPDDFTWRDWLDRTGELPPDFDVLPFLPFLPDPMILDEGSENIPIETIEQWLIKLYSAELDERIAGVISVSGFTPMRTNTRGKTAEGIYEYSHLHGLLPRLCFFAGSEPHLPYDFHEILAAVAPRPLLVVAPKWDQYASLSDVELCMDQVQKVYDLFRHKDKVKLYTPEDYNRFSDDMRKQVIGWMEHNLN